MKGSGPPNRPEDFLPVKSLRTQRTFFSIGAPARAVKRAYGQILNTARLGAGCASSNMRGEIAPVPAQDRRYFAWRGRVFPARADTRRAAAHLIASAARRGLNLLRVRRDPNRDGRRRNGDLAVSSQRIFRNRCTGVPCCTSGWHGLRRIPLHLSSEIAGTPCPVLCACSRRIWPLSLRCCIATSVIADKALSFSLFIIAQYVLYFYSIRSSLFTVFS